MTNTTRAFWNSTILLSALAAGVASQTNEVPHVATPDHFPDSTEMVAAAPTEIVWFSESTIDDAKQQSLHTGKPLWIHFMHDDCAPCVRLKSVFSEPAVVKRVAERFVAVQVNRSKPTGQAIAREYGMANVGDPCDVFVYPGHKPLQYDKPLTEPTAYYLLGRFTGVLERKP